MRNGTALDDKFNEIKELYDYYDKSNFRRTNISEETYQTIYRGLGLLGHSTDALNDFVEINPEKMDKNSLKSYLKIFDKVKFYYENPQKLKEILNSSSSDFSEKIQAIKDNKNITCDDLFGVYLCEMSNYINQTFYKSVIILLRHFRDCMNLLGWEIYDQYKDLYEEKTAFEFCEIINGELLPEICNDFLQDYLPIKLSNFDKHIAMVVICEFCDWIYKRKFTHIRLNPYNDEIQI